MTKLKVLFICKDSAVRSQMAAAFLNAYFGDRYEASYAGIEPAEVNPYAIKVMKEIGIDISSCHPKKIEDARGNKFDCIITLCDYAKAQLPALPEHKNNSIRVLRNRAYRRSAKTRENSRCAFLTKRKPVKKPVAILRILRRSKRISLPHSGI